MRQNLKIRGEKAITRDFLSNRYKKLVRDKEEILNSMRRHKKSAFRQKIDNILKRI